TCSPTAAGLCRPEPLTWFGLAVPYDRDGQVAKSAEAMRNALDKHRALERLQGDGVFFVPEGDLHYYLALAHEALGDTGLAAQLYGRFVVVCKETRYAARAREHLQELGKRAPAAK